MQAGKSYHTLSSVSHPWLAEINLIKVSWGLLGPRRNLMAHIFVIGWIHLPVIFIRISRSEDIEVFGV